MTELLPTIHSYWVGFLMAWSFVTVMGIAQIIAIVKKSGRQARRFDKLSLYFVIVGMSIICIATFFFTPHIVKMIEVMLLLDLWFTSFMVFVSQTCLASLPIVKSIYKV